VTLSPDDLRFALGPWRISATLAGSYLVMALLVFGAALLTRALRTGVPLARGQAALEAVVSFLGDQIRAVTEQDPKPYLPFVGTLFLFIALSNILAVVPGFIAPTSSLSTAMALALCVFVAVPIFGIRKVGVRAYLANYLQPTPWLLPFTLIGELSRTLALAVRLFGNAMSSSVIAAILLLIAPLLFPVVMQAFGLLIGVIQAYIFAILAIVYIASGSEVQAQRLAPRGKEDA
jgi:F-type H+-transporting ATPase subunit a